MLFVNKTKAVVMASVAAALFAASSGSQAATSAANAIIDVTATVVATTCTAGWSSGDQTINLGNIAASDAQPTANTPVGNPGTVTLSLSGCETALKTVEVTASGKPDSKNSTYFDTGLAETAVAFYGGDSGTTLLKPDSSTTATYTINSSHTASMLFKAQLMHTSVTGIAPGAVSSKVNLVMTYK